MSASRIIHSDNFNQKPIWFRVINGVWGQTYPLGTKICLDKDQLIRSARKHTGLLDLGKDFDEEPLKRLVDSLNHEARLHPIGRFISRKRILNLLSVRLRAEDLFKKHPEILEQELYPVTVIIGLQRTGTTKLHRMLASDPETRTLLSWEAINPAPLKGDTHTGKERIRMAKMSEKALKTMSPGFFAIHPVEHLAPEEDVLLLDVSFMSTTPEAITHVPSYAAWLEETDQSQAYNYAVKLLKLLQWQKPAKQWILKTPHHLEFLNLAASHFHDTRFVWTHRNVKEAIPSFLSMIGYSRSLFSDDVNPHEIATHWVRKIGYMLSKALEYRQQNGHLVQFMDVFYEDLVSNGGWVVENIYQQRNLPVDQILRESFQQVEQANPIRKYGKHVYRMEDFGIDRAFIDLHTANYREFQERLSGMHIRHASHR